MRVDKEIQNSNELEFAVFCIENVAAKLDVMQSVYIRHLPKKRHSGWIYCTGI